MDDGRSLDNGALAMPHVGQLITAQACDPCDLILILMHMQLINAAKTTCRTRERHRCNSSYCAHPKLGLSPSLYFLLCQRHVLLFSFCNRNHAQESAR